MIMLWSGGFTSHFDLLFSHSNISSFRDVFYKWWHHIYILTVIRPKRYEVIVTL